MQQDKDHSKTREEKQSTYPENGLGWHSTRALQEEVIEKLADPYYQLLGTFPPLLYTACKTWKS